MAGDKLAEELVIVHYFREKYEAFPKGKLIKSESPDFILKQSPKRQTGIEISRLDYLLDEGSCEEVFSYQLKELIRRKGEKLRLYRKKRLNEYWLVITIDSCEKITGDEREREKLQASFAGSSFDKVFLFDLFSAEIIKLNG